MSTYNERLIANNQKIDDITTLANTLPDASEIEEKIDEQDTIIENLKLALDEKAGKGGAKLNVFTQLTEPTTKKGIWLKTDKQMEHFVSDDNVFIGGTWQSTSDFKNAPEAFTDAPAVSVGTDIYILKNYTATLSNSHNYKYDTLTDTYTRMTDIPYYSPSSAASVGTDIYIFGSTGSNNYYTTAYKYNTLTDTYTQLTNIPYSFNGGRVVSIGTNIYLLGGSDSYTTAYKYDTLTDTYTKMGNCPSFTKSSVVAIGTDIYIFGNGGSSAGSKSAYKYDTLTGTYTSIRNLQYSLSGGFAASVGTDIYIFGLLISDSNPTGFCKYNTLTDTYTQLDNLSFSCFAAFGATIGIQIFIQPRAGTAYNTSKFYCYNVQSKSYSTDNTVVIAQGKTYSVGYNVELLTTELAEEDFQPLYGFADAWFYTTQGGLETDIPTYYGDGTQWINIKNPPSNETNDEGNIEG